MKFSIRGLATGTAVVVALVSSQGLAADRSSAGACKDLATLSLSAVPDAPTQITGTRFVAAAD